MPTVRDPLAIYNVAESIRQCAHEALENVSQGVPDRSCVVPGEIAWDDCECGQLAVAWTQNFYSQNFPNPAPAPTISQTPCGANFLVINYTVSIVRCVPSGGDDSAPPACSELQAAAMWHAEDALAVRTAVWCCLNDLKRTRDENNFTHIVDFTVLEQTSVGPAGMCAGSNLTVQVALNNACPCS